MTVSKKQNRKSFIAAALCLLLAAAAAAILLFVFARQVQKPEAVTPGCIAVHFVDVGQGDCAIVETPDGNILIDAGTKQSESAIRRYIEARGITGFAYAIFTHPHADHIGSAAALVSAYPMDAVVMPNAASDTATFENLVAAIEEKGCRVIEGKAGKRLSLGETDMELLAPARAYDDLNNSSIVLRLTFGNGSFLFTGDAEAVSEADMLTNGVPECDVLKVGHHGSSTSSSEAFIEAVSPLIAVISVGDGNSYGHPHASTVERLEAHGAQIFRTDLCGSITVTCDGTGYTIETEK